MITAQVAVRRTVLPAIPAAMRVHAGLAIKEALRVGQGVAQREAPVDTGFMRNNIVVEQSGMNGKLRSRAAYSGFVNFGTRYMGARPFFTNGANAMNAYYISRWRMLEKGLPRL